MSDVAVDDIEVGDVLLVRPGELIPCDALVMGGQSSVDTSSITGESVPVHAGPGTRLSSGTLHGDSPLTLRATARALLEHVARVNGDLIALGSHGYGLWKRLTLGSVASKVVRLATTAVLVAPIGSLAAPAVAGAWARGARERVALVSAWRRRCAPTVARSSRAWVAAARAPCAR